MKLTTAALLLVSLPCLATDYQCGLYQVSVDPLRSITVDSVKHGTYVSTDFDKYYNFLHLFSYEGRRAIVRETTRGRVAFRVPGVTGWNACTEIEK